MRSLIGQEVSVLVEGPHPDSELLIKARYYGQAPDIDNSVIINDGTAITGEFTLVKITESAGMDLVGSAIAPSQDL